MSTETKVRENGNIAGPSSTNTNNELKNTIKSSNEEHDWDWSYVRLDSKGNKLKSTYPGIHKISDERGKDPVNYSATDWLNSKSNS